MSQKMLAEQMAEDGIIEVQTPEIQVDINIRAGGTRMLEGENGRLILDPESAEFYLEVYPTMNGPEMEVVHVLNEDEFTELEPAEPKPEPDVDNGVTVEQRD